MITLCMDTSHIYLELTLIENDKVIGKVQEACWKKQSEELFPKLDALMKQVNKTPEDIGEIVITKGPGSYTGIRIAMTVAKVFASLGNIPLYTVGTLQLYAGKKNCRVVLDARGNRAYTAVYENGNEVEALSVKDITEIQLNDSMELIGDGHLFNKEDNYPDIGENFLLIKDEWYKEENVHLVTPEYLKSSESYMVKKS